MLPDRRIPTRLASVKCRRSPAFLLLDPACLGTAHLHEFLFVPPTIPPPNGPVRHRSATASKEFVFARGRRFRLRRKDASPDESWRDARATSHRRAHTRSEAFRGS